MHAKANKRENRTAYDFDRTTLKYFKKMDEILGNRPIGRPSVLYKVEAPIEGSDDINKGQSSSSRKIF